MTIPVTVRRVVSSIVITLILAEGIVRAYYAVTQRDWRQLVAFGATVRARNAVFSFPAPGGLLVKEDSCQAKTIRQSVDRFGVRGGDGTANAFPHSMRIVTIGDSSTFGLDSSDDRTWPALLEASLPDAKVFNLAHSDNRLRDMVSAYEEIAVRFHPALVIFSGGYLEGVHGGIPEWHRAHPALRALYNRSMLYTYGVEKAYFTKEASDSNITPDTDGFAHDLSRLVAAARRHGARVVLLIQATQLPRIERLDARGAALTARVRALIDAAPHRYSVVSRSRMIQAQVMQTVVEAIGRAEDIPIVDPRPALEAAVDRPHDAVFCDDLHLGDQGNAIVAAHVARTLASESRAR